MKPVGRNIKIKLQPSEKIVKGIIYPDQYHNSMKWGECVDGNGIVGDGARVLHMNPKDKEIISVENIMYWV